MSSRQRLSVAATALALFGMALAACGGAKGSTAVPTATVERVGLNIPPGTNVCPPN